MAWLTGKHLVWLAAGLLVLCGALHLAAWRTAQAGFSAASSSTAGLIWVLLATARPLLLTSALTPACVAIGLIATRGILSFPAYLQGYPVPLPV